MSKVFYLGVGRVCENEIQELKSIPGVPTRHPFAKRVIGTIRRECLDRTLFVNSLNLQRKLDRYKEYYNEIRGHSSLGFCAPIENGLNFEKKPIHVPVFKEIQWEWYANGACCWPVV